MKRYFVRFKEINDGRGHSQPSLYYDDDVYAFFQNCYYLKDWIKNDPACSSWSSIEGMINKNKDLSICADLCNALKHLILKNKPRSTVNPNFAGGKITLKIDGFNISKKYIVSTSTGDIDAFELAKRCVNAWEQYISANGGTP